MRAEIIDTKSEKIVGARVVINAPAKEIFDVVANPQMHPVIDGSTMVRGKMTGPSRLSLGAKFSMRQSRFVPYVMPNWVVEFEEDKKIGWRNLSPSVWRYEFKELAHGTTEVTQYLDATNNRLNFYVKSEFSWAPKAMAKTLANLKALVESAS